MVRFYYWEEGPTGKVHQLLRMDGYETKEELMREVEPHLESQEHTRQQFGISIVKRAWIMRAEEFETIFEGGET